MGNQESARKREAIEATIALELVNETYKKYEREYKERKASLTGVISRYIKDYCKGEPLEFEGDKANRYRVSYAVPKKVVWDADKLKERLSKQHAKAVIMKEYIVTDIEGLAAYVKELGGDQKVFKSFFGINLSVDQEALDLLDGRGELSPKEREWAAECCMVSQSAGYVKITKSEVEVDEWEGV